MLLAQQNIGKVTQKVAVRKRRQKIRVGVVGRQVAEFDKRDLLKGMPNAEQALVVLFGVALNTILTDATRAGTPTKRGGRFAAGRSWLLKLVEYTRCV